MDRQGNEGGSNERVFDLEHAPPFDPSLIAQGRGRYEEAPAESQEEARPNEEVERIRAEYEARLRSEQESREVLEREKAEQEARASQARFEQWNKEFQDAVAHAETLPQKDAVKFLAEFQSRREQAVMGWGQSFYNENQSLKWGRQAEKIVKDLGLSESDVDELVKAAVAAGNPKVMQEEAKRIKARTDATNAEVQKMRDEIERMKAEMGRAQLASSPVNRIGSGGGRTANTREVEKGSRDHLAQLMGMTRSG